MRTLGKRVRLNRLRGFESLPIRHSETTGLPQPFECRSADARLTLLFRRCEVSMVTAADAPGAFRSGRYFPMQNWPKITPSNSSVSARPTMSPTASIPARNSSAMNSGDNA